ncbi:response regulator [Halobacillus salinus]|uniref:Response regulator n=1 Tax=Halobacillus salinus TaxID=192814 RepID=A0A4Z0GWS6_9BACI|nr:response regulator [Halobacillus salinus]TGB01455.1 response regulator [Halobacillus salinus]
MKWLIAEDEMIEREGLKKMIGDRFPHLEVIGEATTGKEAVELADTLQPDLITMDIKMPGMNGIEAVQHIKKKHPHVRIIMMTAYDEFDYAREVMREGVKEYLLKPTKKKELIATFERVIKEIEEDLEMEKSQQQTFIQSDWVQAYFTERMLENYPEEIASFFPHQETQGCAWMVQLDTPNEEKHAWIREAVEEKAHGLVGPFIGSVFPVWIFAFKEEDLGTEFSRLNPWVRSLLNRFESTFHEKASIGIGSLVRDPNDLIHSYHEATLALTVARERKGYALYQEAKNNLNLDDIDLSLVEKNIYESVRNGSRKVAIQQFEHLWAMLEEKNEDRQERCRQMVQAIYGMTRELGFHHLQQNDIPPPGTSDKAWRLWTMDHIMQVTETIHSYKTVTSKDAISQAEEWIQEHYHESITLEQVAEYIALNPYYFSKLFKERFQQTFIDYVTQVRLTKAKQYLSTTEKPLKEICSLVGYKDPNYFSRVFKKKEGVSPTSYRHQQAMLK